MTEHSGVDSSAKNMNKLYNLSEFHSPIVPSSLEVINLKLTRDNYRDNYWFWYSQNFVHSRSSRIGRAFDSVDLQPYEE
ncbi:hypothetical protein Patl1_32350 [Pistacia atlantica]|uniref:Uncharacterized protein n=1 Tax=Pistacia atlantica TaxID=434234 RepID=A0ACC1AQ05_9ROSI|nr:hypothetical protein Patl1_32350 [Pistacia atlantica]